MEKYKKRTRYFVFLCLTIVWMVVIAWFSNQEGAISQAQSDSILALLSGIFRKILPSATDEFLSFVIRKAAHVMEYLILTVLIFLTNRESIRSRNPKVLHWSFYLRLYVAPFIYMVLFAALDEFHQLFVQERSGQWTDVLWDSVGGCIAILICIYAGRLSYRRGLRRITLETDLGTFDEEDLQ